MRKLKLDQTQFMGFQNILESFFLKQVLHKSRVKTYIFRVFNTYGPGENLKNLKKEWLVFFVLIYGKKNQL